MVSLPSYADDSVVIDPIDVIGQPINPVSYPYNPPASEHPWGQNCSRIGCDSSDADDYDDYQPVTCSNGPNGLLNANTAFSDARNEANSISVKALFRFYAQHPIGSQFIVTFPDGSIGFWTVSCLVCGSGNLTPGLGCNP